MIELYLVFRFVEGRCHGNQLILEKCHKRRLIQLAFFALSIKKELQCHYLNVRVNSGDDVAISCKKLVNFCWVTPEIMELIWERQVRNRQKTGVFRWIFPDILDGFSHYFHHMKALYVQIMDVYLIFQYVKGRCHGNQLMLQTDTTCILCTFARWQNGFGLLLLAWGRHCGAERAIC